MRHKPTYLDGKTPKQKSQQQEKNLAKKGFVIPASGAIWSFKGDVQFTDFLVEAKRTDKKGMRLTEEVLKRGSFATWCFCTLRPVPDPHNSK